MFWWEIAFIVLMFLGGALIYYNRSNNQTVNRVAVSLVLMGVIALLMSTALNGSTMSRFEPTQPMHTMDRFDR